VPVVDELTRKEVLSGAPHPHPCPSVRLYATRAPHGPRRLASLRA